MNFKKVNAYSSAVILTLIIFACTGKKEALHDHGAYNDETVWKEMDTFHMIMAETFHPFKDSANLEPVKTRATELVEAANEWVAAPLPEKVDNDEVKSKLKKLKTEATTLANTVMSADDNIIADQLTQLHDTFHELQDTWYGGHH